MSQGCVLKYPKVLFELHFASFTGKRLQKALCLALHENQLQNHGGQSWNGLLEVIWSGSPTETGLGQAKH